MKINELLKLLDDKYNLDNQEEWDHCGFNNIFNTDEQITNVCICLDLNTEVIEFCLEHNVNVIISHHPLYIGEMSSLNQYEVDYIMKLQKLLADNNITHVVLHTCYDAYNEGTSYQLFKRLAKNTDWECSHITNSKYSIFFALEDAIPLSMFLQLLRNKQLLSRICVKKNLLEKPVKNIAICAGSGYSDFKNILDYNPHVDCFLTADIKWHNFQLETNTILVDIGHDAEKVFIDDIAEFIDKNELAKFEVFKIPPDAIINYNYNQN